MLVTAPQSPTTFKVAMKSVRACAHVAADALHGDVVYVRQSPTAPHFVIIQAHSCYNADMKSGGCKRRYTSHRLQGGLCGLGF